MKCHLASETDAAECGNEVGNEAGDGCLCSPMTFDSIKDKFKCRTCKRKRDKQKKAACPT